MGLRHHDPAEVAARWRYIWRERLFWFQRRRPVFQFEARLYVGRAGSGKTLFATRDAILLMRQGVTVISNYRIWDRLTGRESLLVDSWSDFLRWSVWALSNNEPVVFVIDEIHLWAPSRFYNLSPAWFLGLLAQHRHYGVGIIGTTQNLARCEIVLRELVYRIVFVRHAPYLPNRVPLYQYVGCDPLVLGDTNAPPKGQRYAFSYMPWWVFGGYSTKELMAVNEWHDDDETKAELAALSEEARDLTSPIPPLVYAEYSGGVPSPADRPSADPI